MNTELLQGFYLGDFFVEPLRGQVVGKGTTAHLPPKAAEVLLCLASHPGELVSREDLIDCVWGEGYGSPELLSHAISEIRHAFADHADNPKFIQTLPRRGYRLVTPPSAARDDTATIVLGNSGGVNSDELGLFENLKRRGVFETGLAYLVLGWLLIQVADIVFSQLLLPQWVGTFVTVLVIAGFPVALVLSWFLEIRDGKAIIDELSPRDARRRRFSRTYLSVIAALAIAAVAVFIYDRSIGLPVAEEQAPPVVTLETALPPVQDNSIAVLPFLNLDGSEETRVFANGLVDDVITRLARVPGLLVSSRGDSFTLEPNSPAEKVRERLRVAMYVEGSVQSVGDELRVIVQLIDSATGFHILARTFDRPREAFFDVRDEITTVTVANVQVTLPKGTQALQSVQHDDPVLDAYILYRRGLEAADGPITETIVEALAWFDAALDVDPEYAAAHAAKCDAYTRGYSATREREYISLAEASCARALELNANLDVIYTALGDLYNETGNYEDAETAYLQALDTSPSNVSALIGLSEIHTLQGQPDQAEAMLTRAIGLHPGDWSSYNALGKFLYGAGRYLEAARQFEIVVALDHQNAVGYANLGTAYMLAADFAAAAPAFEKAIALRPLASTYSNLGLMHYYLGDFDAATVAHREATRLAPNDHLAWSNLGDAYWAAGSRDASRQAFIAARSLAESRLAVNPNDAGTLMDLAWISAMLDDMETARALLDRALALLPDDPYAHFINGLVWLRAGNADAALASLQAALERGYSTDMLAAEPHLQSLRSASSFRDLLGGGN